VVCDAARALMVLLMAVPGMPTAMLLVLVTCVALLEPPFSASRAAMLPDVLGEGERYAIGSTLSNTTNNLAVVIGFAIGGALVTGRVVRPQVAPRYMLPMALAMPAVLALTAFDPATWVAGLLWFVAGLFGSMQIIANRVFVATVPRRVRGRSFGIAQGSIA